MPFGGEESNGVKIASREDDHHAKRFWRIWAADILTMGQKARPKKSGEAGDDSLVSLCSCHVVFLYEHCGNPLFWGPEHHNTASRDSCSELFQARASHQHRAKEEFCVKHLLPVVLFIWLSRMQSVVQRSSSQMDLGVLRLVVFVIFGCFCSSALFVETRT